MNKENAVVAVPHFELERINNNKKHFDYIVRQVEIQLCDRLIGIFDTEKELIVKRSDLITVEEPGLNQVQFRESINWRPLVRCKDCKHRDDDGMCCGRGWPIQLVPGDGFCDKGERRDDE